MIIRQKLQIIRELLENFPAVALLGPRQVGKTTLALEISKEYKSIYLDLESFEDRAKIENAVYYFENHKDKLIILDEVQRIPNIFQTLRGVIDQRKRAGQKVSQFLLLGSASTDLLKQSGESLAGRIAYTELSPINITEYPNDIDTLWVRGGFPDSLLATNIKQSVSWRQNFIRTYLERDIPQLRPRIPAETLRRFWTMLAHLQGNPLNASNIAASLGVDGKTVMKYLDLMVDLMLVRRLEPLHKNIRKRLVKSPKIYVRDTGLLHTLLGITDKEQLLSHPIIGMSWEGFIVENILNMLDSNNDKAYFYKTSSDNEIDLILERSNGDIIGVEIKRTLTPKITKGVKLASQDLQTTKNFIIYPGAERFSIAENTEAIGLNDFIQEVTKKNFLINRIK